MASRIKIVDTQLSKRSASSAECVRTLVVLKQQQQIIEKSLNALITNMKASSEISKDIQLDQVKLSVGRTKVCDSLKNTLYDIADELRFVKSTIQNISDIDVNKYRSKLQSLCKKMDEFNKSNVLETLVKEQNQLELELAGFQEQLHRYEKIPAEMIRHTDLRNLKSNQKRLENFADVKNFDSLVARTGHTQRWTDEDHLLFLKLRQKCKSIPSLVHALQSRCPDLSTETIINHESWYKTYLHLRQNQRDQIEEWRRMKQYQKQKKHLESLSDNTEESSSEFSKEHKEESEDSFEKAIKVEIMRKSHILDEIRNEEKKHQIRQWKMKKENERFEEERQIRERHRMRQQEQERQRQERILRMKIELMEYKKKKLMEAERVAEKKNHNDSRNRSKMFKTFRQQDQRYIQRRKQLIQKNNSMNNKQIANNRIAKNKNRIYGNSNRQNFLKTTKGWEQKCAQLFDPAYKQAQQLTYIKDLPRLRTFYRRNMESF